MPGGLQAVYEPPLNPDLTLDGQAPPEKGAVLILDKLKQLLYI
jgi:adenylylsulfate kinase-like enzyme